MKQTITEHYFVDGFDECHRSENFSRSGRRALFGYLTELEGSGPELEYDPIAICCDFSEYATALEAAKEFGFEPDGYDRDDDSEDAQEKEALHWLNDRTTVIQHEEGIVVAGF